MSVRLAIFDFDGTLADTFPFFLKVFNTVAGRYSFRSIAPEEVPALRHYGVREMMRHVAMPRWKLPFVARTFMKLMKDSRHEIALFPGIDAVLAELAAQGVTIAVVSSNSYENIVHVLGPRNAALVAHFECGSSMLGKARPLKRVLRRAGVAAHEAIYVGDQSVDCEAAHAVGMAFGAVAWGYADIAALRRLAPAREFAAVSELAELAGKATAPV